MEHANIAIIGGGLAGLYAAFLLEQRGLRDYVLLEADTAPGGRILSAAHGAARFDLGPAWFWPGFQPELGRLAAQLGLESFAQHESGDMLVERARGEAPQRMRGYANSPPSMRVRGGMAALAGALLQRLDARRVATGRTVRELRLAPAGVEIVCGDDGWRADHVLLALPPRLAATNIAFSPPLPAALARSWLATPTWMAPHAKYVAVYQEPFWRRQGLSGEGRSAPGPLGEIHDASPPDAGGALFGFLGVPAQVRRDVPRETMLAQCRAQLARMFGDAAAHPVAEFFKDWAQAPLTATAADMQAPAYHQPAPRTAADSGPWRGRLTGIGSEWSRQFPGYLAGAVEAAADGVRSLPAHSLTQVPQSQKPTP